MTSNLVELTGSEHSAPTRMLAIGRVPEDEPITISLYLKPKATTASALEGRDRSVLRAQRETNHSDDIAAVLAFCDDAGLQVTMQDAARRLVQIHGPAQAMEQAFGTELHHYEDGSGTVYRSRHGTLSVPADLSERVTAVLGLDTTPIATPKIVPHRGAIPPQGFLPTEVAALYGFVGGDASGQCVGIIELGGGYTDADNQAAFKAMSLPVPEIVAVPVDGAVNDAGDTSGANGEVALDIQVVGGVAPGAKLAVYFAPNTSQGFVDAITQAVHDQNNKPSALSISWGSPEDGWSAQAIAAMHQAFGDAAELGVSVFAASGDSLATDGENDGKAHVDYPASDPLVVGCGGTRITASGKEISDEVVWKSNAGGTGGGVSNLFAKPVYQANVAVPASRSAKGGRGVPDVAGNADPDSGYRIVTGGRTGIIGGTSAVAPLWAGIVARLNALSGKPVGDPHALFYGDSAAFRDITVGDNLSGTIGYEAGKGWDACTGLGSPIGKRLHATL